MIYLDYNATTPVDPQVVKAMTPYFTEIFGNPSTLYGLGTHAHEAINHARQQVATLLGAQASEILFTSCGSESDNMVVKGVALTQQAKGKHIITSQIEHPAILEALHFLEQHCGVEVTYLPVDHHGLIDPADVAAAIRPDTILVTIMFANNEVGTIQPIKAIGEICHQHQVLFHTDASQAVGKVAIDVNALQVDFLTVAGHKIYAPKGIGALYIRDGLQLEPLLHGASQENGRRAGTENVPYDVALGAAAELMQAELPQAHLRQMRDDFVAQLRKVFGNEIQINGDLDQGLPNTANVSFIGHNGAEILRDLPGLAATTGSACHAGSKKISPVLAAMGVDPAVAAGAIRFSVGRYTTQSELDHAVHLLENLIHK